VALATEQVTIVLAPHDGSSTSTATVTLGAVPPAELSLRAQPLAMGDVHGLISFPDNAGHDTIGLDTASLHCAQDASCSVRFAVGGISLPGIYNGAIEAWRKGMKLASTPVSVVRPESKFHPVVTGDKLHDGRISVDIEGDVPDTFLLSVQIPAGSPPHTVELFACPQAGASCPSADAIKSAAREMLPAPSSVGFRPSRFWLDAGASQAVSVTVGRCPDRNPCAATMLVRNGDDPQEAAETVISVNQYRPVAWREAWLLVVTVLGSLISVILNNLFPTNRAKDVARYAVRQVEGRLRDCPNAGNGLLDMLRAEAARLRLVLIETSFASPTKQADLLSVQQATAALTATTELAQRLSLLRVDADGTIMSIAAHTAVRGKLLDAEEALAACDTDSAKSRLDEAQALFVLARNDSDQAELRKLLAKRIPKLMEERGIRARPAANAPAGTPPPSLEQPAGRDPFVSRRVLQVDEDFKGLDDLVAQDLLDTERDFYVADVWTEYMERKLYEFDGNDAADTPAREARDARRQEWVRFSQALLKCLQRCPNADQTQVLIDLVKHDTTLEDVGRALKDGKARIEMDPQPDYLEPVDVAFVITDPVLSNIAAVRRLLSYQWSFGDGSSPPPNVDRCRHFFRRPRRNWGRRPDLAPTISVTVTVPFTDDASVPFNLKVAPRYPEHFSVSRMTDLAGFTTSAAVAIAAAYGAKYASSLPNLITWNDCLTAFLLGFGLDQLRDTVTSPVAASTPNASAQVAQTSRSIAP
jgi:hypothetical protein